MVFNSGDTPMLNKPYIGDMGLIIVSSTTNYGLIKHDSEQTEKN